MSLTKQLIDSSAHAEELEPGVVEYGEVDPPYYEDEWPSEEEIKDDTEKLGSFHVLLTDAEGFRSCNITASSIIECEQKIRERFPTATYWEIGV